MTASGEAQPSRLDALAVYFQPRVLTIFFLGFSSGLPLALSGSTLLFWMAEVGVDLKTIGLFAMVGTPYTIKFLWAPIVDAFDVPLIGRWLGRRRGWLLLTQLVLMAAIVLLGANNPVAAPAMVALGAVMVAAASATQDIVIDAFRVESLPENEQAAGGPPTLPPIASRCWFRVRARCSWSRPSSISDSVSRAAGPRAMR